MPPKAQTSSTRRGRPAAKAAPKIPVAAVAPPSSKKRGRPAKTDVVAAATAEPPKKRGRPAKAQVDEPIAQIDQAIKRGRRSVAAAKDAVAEAPVSTKKRAGRPAKVAAEVAVPPKKPSGRPRKANAAPEAPATPKRRGRPALNLNRVAGSPRVAKRTSPRAKTALKAAPKIAAAPHISSKTRSRPRARTAPVEKAKKVVPEPVKKARGRPKKIEVEEAPVPKKAPGRGRKPSALAPVVPAKKVTARPKTAAPRKRRGYTTLEVADKFAAQVKQYILDLQAEDAANAAAAAGEADDEGEEVEIEIDLGPEDLTGPSDNLQAEIEINGVNGAATELAGEDEEGEDMLIDPVEVAEAAAQDQAQLSKNPNDDAELSPETDDIDEETELPSEAAVLAEVASVQDELDAQNAIGENVSMAGVAQAELERQSSASHQSVDFHEEITEMSSVPQADGSNEVEVFQSHMDGHSHVYETPAPEAATVGSLFSGF